MQKTRPFGVTILAIWALVGSGVMFVWAATQMVQLQNEFVSNFQSIGRYVVVPLGAALANFDYRGIMTLGFGVFYAVIGIFTLKHRRLAWHSNVGLSAVAAVYLTISYSTFFYLSYTQGNVYTEGTLMQNIVIILTYYALIAARLYYLFRPSVLDFFGTKSLFAQKRIA